MTVKCTGFCRRHWTVSAVAPLPVDGYVCPQCQAEMNRIERDNGRRVARQVVRQYKKDGYVICVG